MVQRSANSDIAVIQMVGQVVAHVRVCPLEQDTRSVPEIWLDCAVLHQRHFLGADGCIRLGKRLSVQIGRLTAKPSVSTLS